MKDQLKLTWGGVHSIKGGGEGGKEGRGGIRAMTTPQTSHLISHLLGVSKTLKGGNGILMEVYFEEKGRR